MIDSPLFLVYANLFLAFLLGALLFYYDYGVIGFLLLLVVFVGVLALFLFNLFFPSPKHDEVVSRRGFL